MRSLLGGDLNSGAPHSSLGSTQGARGFEARECFKQELSQRPLQFVQNFRELLADEMEIDVQDLQPAALRSFFRQRVAFGKHRLLNHVGHLLGRLWELAERGRAAELQATIAAGAAFVEQAALSNGRLEVAWLLTGLTEPAPALAPGSPQPQRPGAALLPPRWLAANLAYLRDLDFLRGQLHGAAGAPQRPADRTWAEDMAGTADLPTPRPPRGRRGGRRSRAASASTLRG